MRINPKMHFSLVMALAVALTASPALAQGKGKGQEKKRERPELVRRDAEQGKRQKALEKELKSREASLRDRYEDRRDRDDDDDRWERDDDGWGIGDDRYEDRKGPPFCQSGKGHPVHGRRWCEEKGYETGGDRYGDIFDSRSSTRYPSGSGSYDRAHQDFHRQHDRMCQMRAAERPLDLQWQIRVRSECKQRHDDWHYRAGRGHD